MSNYPPGVTGNEYEIERTIAMLMESLKGRAE